MLVFNSFSKIRIIVYILQMYKHTEWKKTLTKILMFIFFEWQDSEYFKLFSAFFIFSTTNACFYNQKEILLLKILQEVQQKGAKEIILKKIIY